MAAPKTNNTTSTVTLVINGQGAQTSLKEVGAAVSALTQKLRAMKEADDPKAYKELIAQKQAVTAEYRKQKEAIGEVRSTWSKFKTEFSQIATGVVGGNVLTFALQKLVQFIPGAINHSMKLKDELADVAKTTNMTDSEVEELNKTLKTFSTRTTTSELRQLAAVGGQFGVAKEQIDEFVGAADKIGVAIGDQFGGVEAAAQQTLLLRNILGDIKSDKIDQDLLRIGNGLNVLEADGAATAPVMADLTSRMGGVLNVMGVAAKNTMGMSATLQELNVTAERGGTAVVEIFQRMTTESATFAKVAGMPLKEYEALIRKDIWGAFQLYLQGLQKVSGDNIAFNKVLEQSKLTGSGVSEVLGKLSSNMTMLNQKTALAGEALQNTDSIMGEFEKRNHALALGLKNLSEWWNGLMYSDGVQKFLEGGVKLLNFMLGLNKAGNEVRAMFEAQRASVRGLEKDVQPLLEKFNTLVLTTNKNAAQQKELKDITQKIAQAVPEAVTAWDKYGNALDINTVKLREFIVMQRRALEEQKKQVAQQIATEIKGQEMRMRDASATLNRGTKITIPMNNTGQVIERKLTNEEMKQLQQSAASAKEEVQKLKREYLDLMGIGSVNDRRNERLGRSGKPSNADVTPITLPGVTDGTKDKAKKEKKKKDAPEMGITFGDLQATIDGEVEAWNAIYEEVEKERKKAAKEAEEIRKKELEESEAYLKEHYEKRFADLAAQEANNLISTDDYNSQRLSLEEEFLTAQISVKEAYGEKVGELEAKLTDNQAEQNRRRYESAVKFDEMMKRSQEAVQDARLEAYAQGVGALKNFVDESSGLFKALFVAEKAIAIAQVLINLQREIASYYAVAAPLGPAGMAIASTQAVAAKIRAGTSVGVIAAQSIAQLLPKKAIGGYTDMNTLAMDNSGQPEGFTNGPTLFNLGARSFIGGEAGKEYVISNPMLQNPVIANFAAMLEMYRKGQPLPTGGAGTGTDSTMAMMMQMMARIEQSLSQRQTVTFNYSEFERYRDFIEFIRQDAA
jgi:TP901 family phage tail tape measure protein